MQHHHGFEYMTLMSILYFSCTPFTVVGNAGNGVDAIPKVGIVTHLGPPPWPTRTPGGPCRAPAAQPPAPQTRPSCRRWPPGSTGRRPQRRAAAPAPCWLQHRRPPARSRPPLTPQRRRGTLQEHTGAFSLRCAAQDVAGWHACLRCRPHRSWQKLAADLTGRKRTPSSCGCSRPSTTAVTRSCPAARALTAGGALCSAAGWPRCMWSRAVAFLSCCGSVALASPALLAEEGKCALWQMAHGPATWTTASHR